MLRDESGRSEMGGEGRRKTGHEDQSPYLQAYWYIELPTTQLYRLPFSKMAIFEKISHNFETKKLNIRPHWMYAGSATADLAILYTMILYAILLCNISSIISCTFILSRS